MRREMGPRFVDVATPVSDGAQTVFEWLEHAWLCLVRVVGRTGFRDTFVADLWKSQTSAWCESTLRHAEEYFGVVFISRVSHTPLPSVARSCLSFALATLVVRALYVSRCKRKLVEKHSFATISS